MRIGDHCMIGPGTTISTVGHPLSPAGRRAKLARGEPVTIGDDAWLGAKVAMLPGATIGSNVVVAVGAVVTKDVPDNVIVAGVPARVVRTIDDDVDRGDWGQPDRSGARRVPGTVAPWTREELMRKLGLIGGIGPESTIPYYRGIVFGVQERMGERVFPPMTIESLDVYRVLELCEGRRFDELVDYLGDGLDALAAAGADFAALSANTPHIVLGRLQERSPLPLVSIVEAARAEAQRRGLGRVGLLGTIFTMREEFFAEPFERAGITVVRPDADEQELIQARISDELELGVVRPETVDELCAIVAGLRRRAGIEAVVLGCTELPLALGDGNSPVPCLDTGEIHVRALIDEILDDGARDGDPAGSVSGA